MYIPNELIEIIKNYSCYLCSICKITNTDTEHAIFVERTDSGCIYICDHCYLLTY